VVVILNLKPAKLAGQASEAMVLAGVAPLPDGGELVHPIRPPGEIQHCRCNYILLWNCAYLFALHACHFL
jgi:tRNA-binding EMAP/Myf-like protein